MACLLALPQSQVAAHQVSLLRGDDLIQKFWEIEEKSSSTHVLIVEPCYDENKVYDTRSQAVCQFQLFKHSLHAKGQFEEFKVVIKFKVGHSEEVPFSDIEKPPEAVFACPLNF